MCISPNFLWHGVTQRVLKIIPKNLFWTDPHLPPTVPFPHEILIPTIYSMFVYSLCALCFVHKIEQDFPLAEVLIFIPFGAITPLWRMHAVAQYLILLRIL